MSRVFVVFYAGRSLCDGPITCPVESYRLCKSLIVCEKVQHQQWTPGMKWVEKVLLKNAENYINYFLICRVKRHGLSLIG